ncbi:hypothetical protein JHJ32_15510 [Parapedobacter sp. ISTM3]|uniref:hypothetical protein n=1 Tax=Parapedobacter sp. ISTM3 TaxID=2800130 RepID=UPI001907B30E|nr:hypothetical protein [Parapedobacter sp. ISTM3]MBK1441407.1 hypothetical protein [Parapedobacter sp. ISTM3]
MKMYPKLGKRLLALWSPLLLFCLAQGVSLLEVQAKHVKTQQTVSGRVINHDDGTAIVGAVVKVKGTDAGTSTDADGRLYRRHRF